MQHIREKPLPGAQINFGHPLAKGLVGCWLMNEIGQRVFDSSPYMNHGTLNGFGSPPQRSNMGLMFDGVNDYVNCGNPTSLKLNGAMSVEAIVNTSNVVDSRIITKGNGAADRGWELIQSPGLYVFQVASNNTTLVSISGAAPAAGKWMHVVGTYLPSLNLSIYINGARKGYLTAGVPGSQYNATVNVRVGMRPDGILPFPGTIALIRVWNRTLTADEVDALYDNPYDMF